MQVTNTTEQVKSDPLVGLFAAMNIPAQERQGQYELNHSTQLPFKYGSRDENAIAMYEKIGIKVLGRTKGDDLFVDVVLPEGWKRQGTDHAMWNNLLDNKGRIRAIYFYKAAFYDRDAFIQFKTRYDYECIKYLSSKDQGHYETRKVKRLNENHIEPKKMHMRDNGLMCYEYEDAWGRRFTTFDGASFKSEKYTIQEEEVWVPKYKDKYEEYNNTPHYFNIFDGKEVIFSTESNPRFYRVKYGTIDHGKWWKKYQKMEDDIRDAAIGHLNVCFPDWRDITKYWD